MPIIPSVPRSKALIARWHNTALYAGIGLTALLGVLALLGVGILRACPDNRLFTFVLDGRNPSRPGRKRPNRMRKGMRRICLVVPFLSPWIAAACQCEVSLSPCGEVGASDLIFIGTVESIEPNLLNRWNVLQRTSMGSLNSAFADALQNPSAASFAKLKDVYLKMFPDLAPDQKQRFQSAATPSDLSRIFFSTLDRGERVRFKVRTVFKHEDDDDAPPPVTKPKVSAPAGAKSKKAPQKSAAARGKTAKDDDDDVPKQVEKEKLESVVVETAFGDCGVDFQPGETYLVYANSDEGADTFFTGSCTRTRRLSDAGQDLAYLSFYKENRKQSAQLEGFVTDNERYNLDFDFRHYRDMISSPVPGVVIKLESEALVRYAESDAGGRFVFDGLREGDYRTSVYTSEYPLNVKLLAEPKGQRIAAQSCATQILWIPQ
jgi:hypothetical protein